MENKVETSTRVVASVNTPWPNIPKLVETNRLTRFDVGYQTQAVHDNGKDCHFIATAWGRGLNGHNCVTAYGTTPVTAAIHCLNKVRRSRGQPSLMTTMQSAGLSR